MTLETWWANCQDSWRMLAEVRRQGSRRKLRLFFCACCRRIWHLLADERSRNAVQVAELSADGLASEEQREQAAHLATDAFIPLGAAADVAYGDPNWDALQALDPQDAERWAEQYDLACQAARLAGATNRCVTFTACDAACAACIAVSKSLGEDAATFAASAVAFATNPDFEAAYASGGD